MLLASIIDGKALGETVIASFVAGVGLTAAFSLLIFGAARLADSRRDDRPVAAAAYAVIAFAGLAVTLGGLVFGLSVMLSS